ncbi:MAG: NUDIX domain-containing protein [Magnetococcales bacterium]|nr:NUDIX domain-containing protein [Magnetococcales bacterium]MBF0262900.1 NUDIX domain-containing protein [Magnetococcales bacterium]
MKVELIDRAEIYKGFFKLLRLILRYQRFDGRMTPEVALEILERGDAAAVLLYDPDADVVGLIRQFRPGPFLCGESGWCTEIVAGSCGVQRDHEAVALRETLEETGWRPYELRLIHSFYLSPSGSSERIHLYCGLFDSTRPREAGGGLEHENEDIEPLVVPYATALAWFEENVFNSAIAILAMQWLMAHRDRLRRGA